MQSGKRSYDPSLFGSEVLEKDPKSKLRTMEANLHKTTEQKKLLQIEMDNNKSEYQKKIFELEKKLREIEARAGHGFSDDKKGMKDFHRSYEGVIIFYQESFELAVIAINNILTSIKKSMQALR